MSRKRRETRRRDHTGMAFGIAGIFACAIVALVEDIFYSASDVPLSSWRFHPISIFIGTLAFLSLLYLLQSMHDRERALLYLEPYTPLLGFSGINLALKLNVAWLVPVAVACIVWSMAQVRRLRSRKPVLQHSAPK